MTGTWEPANQLEHQLREALGAGDQDGYFRLLSAAELVVPLPQSEPGATGQPAFTWPTSTHEGRTHIMAYTSIEAARACLPPGYDYFARMPLADIADSWPDPDWWLAVNSGLPIEGYLPAWFINQLTASIAPSGQEPAIVHHAAPPSALDPAPVQEPAPGRHAAPPGPEQAPIQDPASPFPEQGSFQHDGPSGHEQAPVQHGASPAPTEAAVPTPPEQQEPPASRPAFLSPMERAAPAYPVAPPTTPMPVQDDAPPTPPPGPPSAPPVPPPTAPMPEISPEPPDGVPPVQEEHTESSVRPYEGLPPAPGPESAPPAPEYPPSSTANVIPPAHTAPFSTGPQHVVAGDEPAPSAPGQDAVPDAPPPADVPAPPAPSGGPLEDLGAPITLHLTADAEFTPLDEEERVLHETAAAGDREGFLRTLLGVRQIWVPMIEGGDLMLGPGRPGFQWYTRESGGRTVVPLFTGPSRMREAMGGHPSVLSDLTKVLRYWPDPAWDLVINDGSPIGASIPGERITALSDRIDGEAAERLTNEFPPQNDTERRLFDARNDPDACLHALLEASVFLPVWSRTPPAVQTPPNDPAFPWAAVPVHGRTSVLAFTSFDWMKEAVGTTGFVMPTFADLLATWPEPGWAVSVNPGTPIEATLSGEQIQAIRASIANRTAAPAAPAAPPEPATAPGLVPEDDLEVTLSGPLDIPLEQLAAAASATPEPAETPAGAPEGAPAETGLPMESGFAPAETPQPEASAGADAPPEPTTAPGETGTPPTPEPVGAPAWGAEASQSYADIPEPAAATADTGPGPEDASSETSEQRNGAPSPEGVFTILQKVLVHDQVAWYLDKAYDRVAGFVHRVQDVIDLNTPLRLYECLGLLRDGSPFSPDDEQVHVIRWPAYRSGLYRTPFGGTTEDALKEWGEDGWVVEAPPFTGDGFAVGSGGSIPEYKVESFKLPHGSEMYVIDREGSERFVARYDADRLVWGDGK